MGNLPASVRKIPNGRKTMTIVRTVFLALAVLLPVSWTVAQAADPAPAGEGEKKDKKSKKEEKKEGEKK
jgi:hypothetical protein